MNNRNENTFIPLNPNVKAIIDFWTKKSLGAGCKDKGGNFNLELYLKYLEAIK